MLLVRLATELEAVRGQVQTECNALRDLFARTTAASMGGSQQERRLNHGDADKHFPQQFVGSRPDCGDFAFGRRDMRQSCRAMDRVARC